MTTISKPIIYITEPDEIDADALNLLSADYDLISGNPYFEHVPTVPIVGLLIRSRSKITIDTLKLFPQLSFIIRVGVGLDTIDVPLIRERGIQVFNASGSNADAVAEYVIGMMLMASRKWYTLSEEDILNWNRKKFIGLELKGKTIGIVGFGYIGRLVYQKLIPWGCNFTVYDPYIADTDIHYFSLRYEPDLNVLLSTSNVITLHIPLTPETHHLLHRSRLEMLPVKSILINSSRGGIVDENAIIPIFERKQSIYVSDVFEGEPLVNQNLIHSPNVIATPHIAAMTEEANRAMAFGAIENFIEHRQATIWGYGANQHHRIHNERAYETP